MTFTLPGKRISAVYYPRPLGEGRVRVLIVIVLTAIMLGKPTFAADKIRIGYSGMTISNALLWVTEEGKLFEKNGIDAEVLYLSDDVGTDSAARGRNPDVRLFSGVARARAGAGCRRCDGHKLS